MQPRHGGIGKNHAPAKGVVRLVALQHGDAVFRVPQFHEQPKIQACWPTAQAHDVHDEVPCFKTDLQIVLTSIVEASNDYGQSDEAGQGPKKKQLEKAAWEGFIGS